MFNLVFLPLNGTCTEILNLKICQNVGFFIPRGWQNTKSRWNSATKCKFGPHRRRGLSTVPPNFKIWSNLHFFAPHRHHYVLIKANYGVVEYASMWAPTSKKLVKFVVFYQFLQRAQCEHCARIASAVLATAIASICLSVRPSIRPSVCPSFTRRYCVKMTARSMVQFAPLDSKMCLVL